MIRCSFAQSIPSLKTTVNVTAERGILTETESGSYVVTITNKQQIKSLFGQTLGNALEGQPGVLVQQSTSAQVSPFFRGLTGYQVLNLVDGIRFNNSTFRSGPNQYLAFIDPAQVSQMETISGPAGGQYGSDAMGGVIHVLTPKLDFGQAGLKRHGEFTVMSASGDRSVTGSGQMSIEHTSWAWLIGGAGQQHGDIRPGGGVDSRHVLRRLFDLDPTQIAGITGSRMAGTGFDQNGFHTKFAMRPRPDHLISGWYQRGRQGDVNGYKDLWGGLGRTVSSFEPQGMDFAYGRYEKQRLAILDTISATLSLNRQTDGTLRQGLRTSEALTADSNSVRAIGYGMQAGAHIGSRQTIIFGGDWHGERIASTRFIRTPTDGRSTPQRALYPNGATYRTLGLFAQDSLELIPKKLRAVLVGRWTRVSGQTHRDNLGVADSNPIFRDATFQTSLSWQATQRFGLHASTGRGFRAPNWNDLGAIGLNDLGYEIPAAEAAPAGALLGNSSGENALSIGRSIDGLKAESVRNYELGVTVRAARGYMRIQGFHADLRDPIVRRTLLFAATAVPQQLAGLPVIPIPPTTAQREQGVVTVATNVDPRAVKAFVNDGQTRYYGLEWIGRLDLTRNWKLAANYSYIVGRDLFPNRHVRRLPPQLGMVSLRRDGRWWLDLRAQLAGAQSRLNGGDIDDERIGASRRRRDIADFFAGSRIEPYLQNGRLMATGETLRQIQDRVLPLGAVRNGVHVVDDATRVPLYLATAGWVSIDAIGGFQPHKNWRLGLGVRNLLDRNYRVHGSGIDAIGVNVFATIQVLF